MRIPPVMMREFMRSYALLELMDNPRSVDALEDRPLETWRAMSPKNADVVVIRRVNVGAGERTAKEAKRLLERELRMREGIHHLSLPAVIDVQLDHNRPFFVLSHHPGVLFQDVLARSKRLRDEIPLPVLLSLMKDLVSALQARLKHRLHDAKSLGELWPGSVRIDWTGRAMHLSCPRTKVAVVEEHDIWRRVPWMSPEEAAGLYFPDDDKAYFQSPHSPGFASRSEMFTIGLMIYAMATKSSPFEPLLTDALQENFGNVLDADFSAETGSTLPADLALSSTHEKQTPPSFPDENARRPMPLSPIPQVARRYARIAQARVKAHGLQPLHSLRADLPVNFCTLVDQCLSPLPLVRMKPFDAAQEITHLGKEIMGSHADTVAVVLEQLFSDEKQVWDARKNEMQLLELGGGLGLASYEGIDIP